jgi:hypothetical protein
MATHRHGPPVREVRRDFGLRAAVFEPSPEGFESECWIVDEAWLVKVWRDRNHLVDLGIPTALAEAGLPVPRPLRSDRTRTDDGRPYAVFPFVRGRHATNADAGAVGRLLRRVHDLPTDGLPLQAAAAPDELLTALLPRLDHPWIADRAPELTHCLHRYEIVLGCARSTQVQHVLSHDDLTGANVLIDDRDEVVAALDWDWARLGPREHDLWIVTELAHPRTFLDAYGVEEVDIDPTHIEFGLLRRALGDLTARVVDEVDRPGVTTWGFDRLDRIGAALSLFR